MNTAPRYEIEYLKFLQTQSITITTTLQSRSPCLLTEIRIKPLTAMSLSSLPRELLLDIAEQLKDAEMSSVARTNGQVYNLVNERLYRRDLKRRRSKALIWSVKKGEEAAGTVQRALAAGQRLDTIPESYHDALRRAADQGRVLFVELLLKVDGINPNFGGSQVPTAPLVLAARNGHSAVVEMLLDVADTNPNVTDEKSASPLLYACASGDVSMVKSLLARDDVDLNALGFISRLRKTPPITKQRTSLAAACENGHTEIVRLLLAQDGIDVNLYGNDDRSTPLQLATIYCGEVVESFLTRDDVDVNILDSSGNHALLWAVESLESVQITKSILDRPNVDPNSGSRSGPTALGAACATANLDLVKLLLNREGIDINRRCTSLGRTPLFRAVDRGDVGIVKLLLDRYDINPNLPDNNGCTPLSWASQNGNLLMVKVLEESMSKLTL